MKVMDGSIYIVVYIEGVVAKYEGWMLRVEHHQQTSGGMANTSYTVQ